MVSYLEDAFGILEEQQHKSCEVGFAISNTGLHVGMGPAPSAPVPRVGYGRSTSFGPGAPMMLHPQDNRASAPLPAGGLQHGILPEGHFRGRKGHGRNGGSYNPQAMVSRPTADLRKYSPLSKNDHKPGQIMYE